MATAYKPPMTDLRSVHDGDVVRILVAGVMYEGTVWNAYPTCLEMIHITQIEQGDRQELQSSLTFYSGEIRHIDIVEQAPRRSKNLMKEEYENSEDDSDEAEIHYTPNARVMTEEGEHLDNMIIAIKSHTKVGVHAEGINLGRDGRLCWLFFEVDELNDAKPHVYMLDVCNIGKDLLSEKFKTFFEAKNIMKVIHDSRSLADYLYHQCDIKMTNVYDTQIADVHAQLENTGKLPETSRDLRQCILYYLPLLRKVAEIVGSSSEMSSPEVQAQWEKRPVSEKLCLQAYHRVRYLRNLRKAILESVLQKVNNAIDFMLAEVRDADAYTADVMASKQCETSPALCQILFPEKEDSTETVSIDSKNCTKDSEKEDSTETVSIDSKNCTKGSEKEGVEEYDDVE